MSATTAHDWVRTKFSARHLTALLVLMCSSLALTIAANVSLNVALPQLGEDLGASQSQLSWVMNAYTLPFAAFLLPAGAVADRLGLRNAVSLGLLVFGAASLVSAFLTDADAVIALRVVSALGATLVLPATLSVLTRSYPPEQRTRVVGIWAAVSGSGAVLGLLMGGVLTLFFWWGSVLAATGAVAVVVAVLCYLVVPGHGRRPGEPLDGRGSILFALALGLLVFGLMQGPEVGWGSAVIVGSFAGGIGLLVAFVLAQLRTAAPLLDVRLFRSPGLSIGSAAIVLQFAATIGLFLILPQMLQNVRGYGPLASALALVPLPVGIALGSQLADRARARLGDRTSVAGGVLVSAVAFAGLGLQGTYGDYWVLGVVLVVFGAGFGVSTTVATTMIIEAVPGGESSSIAAALNDALREIGAAVGIAALGTVLNVVYRSQVAVLPPPFGPEVVEGVRDGFGPATRVVSQVGEAGPQLLSLLREAFYAGYRASSSTAAAALVVVALVALLLGRRSHRRSTGAGQGEVHPSLTASRARSS